MRIWYNSIVTQNHYSTSNKTEHALKATTAQIIQAVEGAQAQHGLFPIVHKTSSQPQAVVVGVSGGADSVCLLHALSLLAAKWNIALHVAHLDHNLRPESAQDAAFVEALATKFGVPFHLHNIATGALRAEAGGVENAARNARHAFFHTLAASLALDPSLRQRQNSTLLPVPVAVAHHADDQVETMLMRMVRGSGLRGLSGMRWCQEIAHPATYIESADGQQEDVQQPKMRVVRPLLGVTRQQIRAYLAENDLAWVEDASNRSTDILRNQIRHQIVPLLKESNPNLPETIAHTAELVASEAHRAETADRAVLQMLTVEQNEQRLVIDLARFLAFDEKAIQRGIIRQALEVLADSTKSSHEQISYRHIDTLLGTLHQKQQASGPHPIVGALAWTVIGPYANSPQRLSLHLADSPPFAAEHPHLDVTWRETIGELLLPKAGSVAVGNGWVLDIQWMSADSIDKTGLEMQNRWCAHMDAEKIAMPTLRTPIPGERIAPLGLNGKRKKIGDLFTDQKIPKPLREGWPIVVDSRSGALLWVCGISIAHHARITKDTYKAVRLGWRG